MNKAKLRIFVPVHPDYRIGQTGIRGSVKQWVWTKRTGLRVHYKDGSQCKSDWTLPQLLKAAKEGRETPIREVSHPLAIF